VRVRSHYFFFLRNYLFIKRIFCVSFIRNCLVFELIFNYSLLELSSLNDCLIRVPKVLIFTHGVLLYLPYSIFKSVILTVFLMMSCGQSQSFSSHILLLLLIYHVNGHKW